MPSKNGDKRSRQMGNPWGAKVLELLKARANPDERTPAWLADQIGAARTTVQNWVNSKTAVRPEPYYLTRTAEVFGVTAEELAPFGQYPMTRSRSAAEREARRVAIPVADNVSRAEALLNRLSPRDQDKALSFLEVWAAAQDKPPLKMP